MKILVFSDSHGNRGNMRRALLTEAPQAVFHLGDGNSDVRTVLQDYPELDFYGVAGNCDWRTQGVLREQIVTLEGVRFLLCHGHEHAVKSGYTPYMNYGRMKKAKVLLAGHTHIPAIWQDGATLLMNPGSVGNGARPTYGVLEVEEGVVTGCEIRTVSEPVYEW